MQARTVEVHQDSADCCNYSTFFPYRVESERVVKELSIVILYNCRGNLVLLFLDDPELKDLKVS